MKRVKSTAVISPCGLYRYRLTRTWNGQLDPLVFVMLNPSTADAHVDDPTIRRCIGYAKREWCGGIVVVNLMAYRATKPNVLPKVDDPVGSANLDMLMVTLAGLDRAVVAWGGHRSARMPFARPSIEMVASCVDEMVCLGISENNGSPHHPLMQPTTAPLILWSPT